MPILIIAYGNSLRRDDGAGLQLAPHLVHSWEIAGISVNCLTAHQLLPEHAEAMAQPDITAVFFVDTRDATLEKNPQPEIHPVSMSDSPSRLGHHINPSLLLTYAQMLYQHRPPTWVITLPGVDFGHGEGLSQTAQTAIAQAMHIKLRESLQPFLRP